MTNSKFTDILVRWVAPLLGVMLLVLVCGKAHAQEIDAPILLSPKDFVHVLFADEEVEVVEFQWRAEPTSLHEALNPEWFMLEPAEPIALPKCYTATTHINGPGYVRIRYKSTADGDPSPWSEIKRVSGSWD